MKDETPKVALVLAEGGSAHASSACAGMSGSRTSWASGKPPDLSYCRMPCIRHGASALSAPGPTLWRESRGSRRPDSFHAAIRQNRPHVRKGLGTAPVHGLGAFDTLAKSGKHISKNRRIWRAAQACVGGQAVAEACPIRQQGLPSLEGGARILTLTGHAASSRIRPSAMMRPLYEAALGSGPDLRKPVGRSTKNIRILGFYTGRDNTWA